MNFSFCLLKWWVLSLNKTTRKFNFTADLLNWHSLQTKQLTQHVCYFLFKKKTLRSPPTLQNCHQSAHHLNNSPIKSSIILFPSFLWDFLWKTENSNGRFPLTFLFSVRRNGGHASHSGSRHIYTSWFRIKDENVPSKKEKREHKRHARLFSMTLQIRLMKMYGSPYIRRAALATWSPVRWTPENPVTVQHLFIDWSRWLYIACY